MHTGVSARVDGGSKIIIVEDDAGVRRSLQLLLQAQGYVIRSFGSSKAAGDEDVNENVVCLITDYRMPELDGVDLLRVLRARGWQGPAILITAYHSPTLVQQALEAGFSMVIDKPLRERSLTEAVARLTGRPAK